MGDGNIVAARTALDRAIRNLTEKRPGVYHDVTLYAPSLYSQLCSELAGTQGDNKTPAKSLPPVHIDAVQLKQDIDTQTFRWVPKPGSTPQRLEILSVQLWRPQDTKQVQGMAHIVRGWCQQIINLLDPPPIKTIPVACPSCNRTHVYRKDSAGEVVRQHALQLVVGVGCTCRHCEAHWSPDRYLFLSKLLGFDMPEGVLE